MEPKARVDFILASKSPRRRQLLSEAGYSFKVVASRLDESALANGQFKPAEYAGKLALAKARDVAAKYPDKIVLGADTVVDCEGEIIGKAIDENHAEQIIRTLFTRPHKVITAVAIVRLHDDTEIVETDSTTVFPKPMSETQIAEHINSGDWRDKAGAYAIQQGSDRFIEKIEGSYTNVMGLPMELVRQMLAGLT